MMTPGGRGWEGVRKGRRRPARRRRIPRTRVSGVWGNKLAIDREELSIDEMVVKYFGHHPIKRFMKGKADPCRIQAMVLATVR